MISNFRYQLRKAGMEHRLPEVLDEIGRVRGELGYPIMVTPYSQFVGVQATMNVITGERYKTVCDEIIQYAVGLWGGEESAAMDATVRDKILDRPRAKELRDWIPPQPSLPKLREQFGGPGVSDDELLLRYFSSQKDVATMKGAAVPKPYSGAQPLLTLLESLLKREERRQIYIRAGEATIRIERRSVTPAP